HLSIHRVLLLYKQYVHLHIKQMLIVVGATVVVIAGFHTFMHLKNLGHLERTLNNNYHVPVFLFAFFGGCLIWCGQAFPGFRSKEKIMDYLMTPASSFEKFLFEFTNRILLYLILFPIIYWAVTNLVTGIFQQYNPEYINYKFAYGDLIGSNLSNRELSLAMSLGFLMFTLPFTGATYFQKIPLLKTILIVALLVGIYFGIGFLLFKGLHIQEYRLANGRLLFMYNAEDGKLAGICAAILGNLVILAIGYFKIKEKEV
ncbi:MAG: hypothetical protein KAI29_27715, partial [Cyclobacteriaceae bacterium]|nr:hypothetical protein [Cyclobacteriaceae bacterium]